MTEPAPPRAVFERAALLLLLGALSITFALLIGPFIGATLSE
ncbi:MAG: hypothetical protein ACOYLK_12135 [Sphingomonas sp.]